MTKRRRHTPDQVIRKLAEGNKLLAGGADLEEVCRHLAIGESTWHCRLVQYGGMKASDAKRLKELEGESARLKKLLAEVELELELDKAMLEELAEGGFRPRTTAGRPFTSCRSGSGSLNPRHLASSGNTARPSAWPHRHLQRTRPPCAASYGTSRSGARGGAGVGRPRRPAGTAGGSTTSGSSASGGKRA